MRILLAEDDTVTRVRIGALLEKWGYELTSAGDGTRTWEILQADDPPRLVLLDWMMPGMDGVEICRRLRDTRREGAYVYVLILTNNSDKHDVVAGLEAGADDYLTKPFEPQELRMRLRAGARIVGLEEALRAQATRDALTLAWNRRGIQELLERELRRADRTGWVVLVLLVDLDQFKHINDTYGHPAGDAVLVEVVRRLALTVCPYDGVGRFGGEEFLLVVPVAAGTTTPEQLGERLRAAIAATPVRHGALEIPVTGSFGAIAASPDQPVGALLKALDDALYRAKTGGRNRVEVATDLSAADVGGSSAWHNPQLQPEREDGEGGSTDPNPARVGG